MNTLLEAIAKLKKTAADCNKEAFTREQLQEFMSLTAQIIDDMNYKLQKLETEISPGSAFIDPNDAPHRLR
jgi:hypothetical protein